MKLLVRFEATSEVFGGELVEGEESSDERNEENEAEHEEGLPVGAGKEDEAGTLNHVIIGDSSAEGVGVGVTNKKSEKETKSERKDERKETELKKVDEVDKNKIAASGASGAIEGDGGSVLTDEANEGERHNKDSDKDETEERNKEEVVESIIAANDGYLVTEEVERYCVGGDSTEARKGEVVFIGVFGISETNYGRSARHEGYGIVGRYGVEEVSDGGGTVVEDDSITTYITH